MLTPLLRGFEEMNLMADNNVKQNSSLIVEVLPEIRARILNGKNWHEIAIYQAKTFFSSDAKQAKEDIARLVKLYSSEVFEDFMEDPKCVDCGKPATQRCSKCKNAWYCSRDCQLRQWKSHKVLCMIVAANREEEKLVAGEIKKE